MGAISEKDRIAFIIETYEGGQNIRFARKVGTSKSSVTKLLNGAFRIGTFAERIVRAYPQIDPRWLLTGEGEPVVKRTPNSAITAKLDNLSAKVDEALSLLEKMLEKGR